MVVAVQQPPAECTAIYNEIEKNLSNQIQLESFNSATQYRRDK